jgi:hypothetical protein
MPLVAVSHLLNSGPKPGSDRVREIQNVHYRNQCPNANRWPQSLDVKTNPPNFRVGAAVPIKQQLGEF